MNRKILFSCRDIQMQFPATLALQDVCIDIFEGEIVGLVGENGAGKSTLLKIIMGVQKPTKGEMLMNNAAYSPKSPKEANLNGIGMVFQEQSLIANLTVGQNIFFGREKEYLLGPLINYRKMYRDTQRILDFIDIGNVRPEQKVSDLDFATRQMVEIAKTIQVAVSYKNGKSLILLDEPTSVLNEDEINKLFNEIKKLKQEGNSVIFVSHHLDEVINISDRVYVFKDGKQVAALTKGDFDEKVLYEKMVGRVSTGEYYKEYRQQEMEKEILLEVKNLGLYGCFKGVSFQLHKKEILGICGVVASGKEELCDVIAGIEEPTSGEIMIGGNLSNLSSAADAVKNGLVCIPQERNEEGIFGSLSIMENTTISNLSTLSRFGIISKKMQITKTNEWIKKLNIKCPNCFSEINSLSGGNAQKVVFARALNSSAKILILNHPTRGVDVGAKEEIYNFIRDAIDEGMGIILLGDTLDETIGLASRIIVMKDGVMTKEFSCEPGKKPEQFDIVRFMM